MQELTEKSFSSAEMGDALILFETLWCPHCHAMRPVLKEIEAAYPSLGVYRVNAEKSPTVARRFSVRTVPTLLLLKDGQEEGRVFGFLRDVEGFLTEAGIQKSKAPV